MSEVAKRSSAKLLRPEGAENSCHASAAQVRTQLQVRAVAKSKDEQTANYSETGGGQDHELPIPCGADESDSLRKGGAESEHAHQVSQGGAYSFGRPADDQFHADW